MQIPEGIDGQISIQERTSSQINPGRLYAIQISHKEESDYLIGFQPACEYSIIRITYNKENIRSVQQFLKVLS